MTVAGTGKCSADFLVTDATGKPLENAQVSYGKRHGFLGLQKTDFQVATDSFGRALFTGLPADPSLKFTVRSGGKSKTVADDSSTTCKNHLNVQMPK